MKIAGNSNAWLYFDQQYEYEIWIIGKVTYMGQVPTRSLETILSFLNINVNK